MMHALSGVFEYSKAVMACIYMQETSLELAHKIADPKAQQTLVEGQSGIKIRDHKHNMSHAQGASAKARDVTARLKRRVGQQWPVKGFKPVPVGITK